MDTEDILNLKLGSSDFDEDMTIRGYFCDLLTTLWWEGEGFSGKRPFGNGGWQHDIYKPLIVAGVIDGFLDEDGWIETCDVNEADEFIVKLIESMFSA